MGHAVVEVDEVEAKRRAKKGDEEFIAAIACGMTVTAAAEAAGIARSTAYRRLAEPEVKRMIDDARATIASESVGKLVSATGRAVQALDALLGHESANIRLAAARALLGAGVRVVGQKGQSTSVQHDEKVDGEKVVRMRWGDR